MLASVFLIANVIQYASEAELVHRKGALTDERVSNGERMVLRKLRQLSLRLSMDCSREDGRNEVRNDGREALPSLFSNST